MTVACTIATLPGQAMPVARRETTRPCEIQGRSPAAGDDTAAPAGGRQVGDLDARGTQGQHDRRQPLGEFQLRRTFEGAVVGEDLLELAVLDGLERQLEEFLGVVIVEVLAAQAVDPCADQGPVVRVQLQRGAQFQRKITAVGAVRVGAVADQDSPGPRRVHHVHGLGGVRPGRQGDGLHHLVGAGVDDRQVPRRPVGHHDAAAAAVVIQLGHALKRETERQQHTQEQTEPLHWNFLSVDPFRLLSRKSSWL